MKLGLLKESKEQRVAITPSGCSKLKDLSVDFLIEKDAGQGAFFADSDYAPYGKIAGRKEVLQNSDLIISIQPLPEKEWASLPDNVVYVSQFEPFNNPEVSEKLKNSKIRALSLDMIPRITLAQSMDILSSMASIAGYQAVLVAARYLPRYFPMLITAAGTIRPAKVLVLGAGVAGLQSIATAKRLGAVVEAFDTRAAAKEEVLSLGARFVEVEGAKDEASAGGYAVEQSEEFLKRQREEVLKRAKQSDVIITTAQVRGRKAPMLVPKETVEQMKPGSVIVDLAASTGGNCALTENDKEVMSHGVTIIGDSNLAGRMPQDSSELFSNNLVNFLKVFISEGEINLDMENEIISSALITQ